MRVPHRAVVCVRLSLLRPGISERELECADRRLPVMAWTPHFARPVRPPTRTPTRPMCCRVGDVVRADISACLDGLGDLTCCATVGPPSGSRGLPSATRRRAADEVCARDPVEVEPGGARDPRDAPGPRRGAFASVPGMIGGLAIHEPPFLVPRGSDAARPWDDLHGRAGLYRSEAFASRTTWSFATAHPRRCQRFRSSSSSSRASTFPQAFPHVQGGSSERHENHRPQQGRESRPARRSVGRSRGRLLDRASARTVAMATHQANVKAVAFFGFAAANSFAQATWAGVKQAAKQAGVTAKRNSTRRRRSCRFRMRDYLWSVPGIRRPGQ